MTIENPEVFAKQLNHLRLSAFIRGLFLVHLYNASGKKIHQDTANPAVNQN